MKTPKKFTFTFEDISRITGLSVGNLRVMVSRKLFNPKDLQSVVHFVASQWHTKFSKLGL